MSTRGTTVTKIMEQSNNVTRLTVPKEQNKTLREYAETALRGYFEDLNGHKPNDLYTMVIHEIEQPLLKTVLEHTRGNQSHAAQILGINRSTLRKKLRLHGLHD